MGGRHRAVGDAASRREDFLRRRTTRRRSRLRRAAVALGVVALVAAASAFAASRMLGCTSTTTLSVAASPDIAAAVEQVASGIPERSGSRINAECTNFAVSSHPSDEVAEALAAGKPASVGNPDVWIPDSSLWTSKAAADNQAPLGESRSIAQSPVVVAMVRPAAEQQGWPGTQPTWSQVVASLGSSPVKFGIADPTKSSASLLTLAGLRDLLGSGAEANLQLVAAARTLSARLSATTDDVLSKLPRTPEEITQSAAGRVGAFPYTEQGVWAYNQKSPDVPLVAIYPQEGTPYLDYPYTPMTRPGLPAGQAQRVQDAAATLLDRLRSDPGTVVLEDHGFRSTSGETGLGAVPGEGVLSAKPKALPSASADQLDQLQRLWAAASLSGRILTVVDVSGSMGEEVPGAPGKTRMDLSTQAVLTALPLLREDTSVGLWTFSTKLDGNKDYRQVVPIRPLSSVVGDASQRTLLNSLASRITWKPGGGTGLYDTILAGYRTMTDEYEAGKINALVVMTDGKNEDPGSISREALINAIKSEFDPEKPVILIIVAFGPEVDAAEVEPIAQAAHGEAHVTKDPRAIIQILLEAILGAAATTR